MRVWAKKIKDNHIIADITLEDFSGETRTHKIFNALDEVSRKFDLEKPIWLDSNVKDFKRHSKTRFNKDSFIEEIDFDYLEFEILDEDQ